MADITFSTGVVEVAVNGGRKIKFNPSDIGFFDTLCSMMAKVEKLEDEGSAKRAALKDADKIFDNFRKYDEKEREAVDSVFGEGFCEDVFDGVRLSAMADGLSVLENFVFAVFDLMSNDIIENVNKRDARIAKYVDKYKDYGKKNDKE